MNEKSVYNWKSQHDEEVSIYLSIERSRFNFIEQVFCYDKKQVAVMLLLAAAAAVGANANAI